MLPYVRELKDNSRTLRNTLTDAEQRLWTRVRRKQLKGFQFFRQKVIGSYIVDFFCPKAKLVIELDGGQHYSEQGLCRDMVRDRYLSKLGLTIMRFSDSDVLKNTDEVVTVIWGRL